VKNIIAFIFVALVMAFSIFSCNSGSSNEVKNPVDSSRVVLPASGIGDNEVFKSTGETVVFFERSPSSSQEKGLDKDSKFQAELEKFREFARTEMEKLKGQGYNCFKSQENHIKITVTKSQVFVVNTNTRSENFGVILTKLDTEPKIISGMPTPEALQLEIEQFYKKP